MGLINPIIDTREGDYVECTGGCAEPRNGYATGRIERSGPSLSHAGGLVGRQDSRAHVASSFWDTQTSSMRTSSGGMGKITAEMQTAITFLNAGWDFMGEAANGAEDIWWILEGQDYPRLWWELIDEN